MKIASITEKNLQSWADSNAIDSDTLRKISQKWSHLAGILGVLIFPQKENRTTIIRAVVPIINLNVLPNFGQIHARPIIAFKDEPKDSSRSSILQFAPYPCADNEPSSEDVHTIVRLVRIDLNWKGDTALYIHKGEEGSKVYKTEGEISWEEIKTVRILIQRARQQTGVVLRHMVRLVESLQREFDIKTEFAECQLVSHSVIIHLDDRKETVGKFESSDLVRVIENTVGIIKIADSAFEKKLSLRLSAIVPGSNCAIGDLDLAEDGPQISLSKDDLARIESTESNMLRICKAAPAMMTKATPPAERINAFMKETGLSPKDSLEVMQKLHNIRKPKQTVELIANSTGEAFDGPGRMTVTLGSGEMNSLAKNKLHLASIIEPNNEKTIRGKVVELDHHRDEDLRFGIDSPDEKNTLNIHYEADIDDQVRSRKGTFVGVRIMREGPNQPWYFQNWVAV